MTILLWARLFFIIQFMGIGGYALSKTAIVDMSYYCLCKAIQLGNKKRILAGH